jgi:hypothetical protein
MIPDLQDSRRSPLDGFSNQLSLLLHGSSMQQFSESSMVFFVCESKKTLPILVDKKLK